MMRMTYRQRPLLGAAVFLGLLTALGAASLPAADAQTRPKGKPKPKTGGTAAASAAPLSSATPSAGPVASVAASTGPIPAPRVEPGGDGGVRASPLNPTAEEMPAAAAPAGSVPAPAATVDYDKILGDIAMLRARVADVADSLFVSRIVISVQTDGDHAKVGHLTVELDDGIVYTAPPGYHASDPETVYEHSVAPGRHAVTVDIDRKDDRDDTFRDTQRSRFIVDVPKDQRLSVTLRVGDDSTMGGDFPGDHRGKYDLRVRMKAAALPVKR